MDPDAEESETIAAVGARAAAYLEATLSATDRIGISSWSVTLLAMFDRMRPSPAKQTELPIGSIPFTAYGDDLADQLRRSDAAGVVMDAAIDEHDRRGRRRGIRPAPLAHRRVGAATRRAA